MIDDDNLVLSIDESIRNVIKRHRDTSTDRELLRTKLRSMISTIPSDKLITGKDLEATTTLFNSFQNVLDGIDKQDQVVAKLLMSKKTTEDTTDTSRAVVEYLRRRNEEKASVDFSNDSVKQTIDTVYEEQCKPITDGELE